MSKKANHTAIGAFVVVGAMLLVAAVMVLGSGKFFSKTYKHVVYFSGSVQGLQLGAPVKFRGVPVGTVSDISLVFRRKDQSMFIPVVLSFEEGRAAVIQKDGEITKGEESEEVRAQTFTRMINERGLKARLAMQSFVTGQLFVQLDFLPDEEIRLVGLSNRYPEIPTVPSGFEKLSQTLEKIPFDEIVDSVKNSLHGIEKVANSKELFEAINALTEFLKEGELFIEQLDSQIPGARVELQQITAQVLKTLGAYERFVAEGAPVEYETRQALTEIKAAARSLRVFADYLERHPEALIKGKQ